MNSSTSLRPGDFAILLAEPWSRHVNQCQHFLRDKLEDMIWWGYRVESVNGNRATIQSMTALEPIRETVPLDCLVKVETKAKKPVVKEIPDPYPVGARVTYLHNQYTIESVEFEASGEPVYNLKSARPDLWVWSGDRVWHSLIDVDYFDCGFVRGLGCRLAETIPCNFECPYRDLLVANSQYPDCDLAQAIECGIL